MALNLSGKVYKHAFDGSSKTTIAEGVKFALLQVDWVEGTHSKGTSTGTITANPSNGHTVTLGSWVYTFRTTINNSVPREVLIGATKEDSLANLKTAVNGGAGSGTLYSSATTAHPDVDALDGSAATEVVITAQVEGPAGNGFATSGTLTWSSAQTTRGSYQLISPRTPHGLKVHLWIYTVTTGADVYFQMASAEVASVPAGDYVFLRPSTGRTYTIGAGRYSFLIYAPGLTNTGEWVIGGMLFLIPGMRGLLITAASTSAPVAVAAVFNETPMRVHAPGHGLQTGERANLTGTGVADGYWTVTRLDDDYYTLDGSTANGTSSTGSSTRAIQITTETAHSLASGDPVYLANVSGNTNANGTYTARAVTTTSFFLDAVGNGSYAPAPGEEAILGTQDAISVAFFLQCVSWTLSASGNGWRANTNTGGDNYNRCGVIHQINANRVDASGTMTNHQQLYTRTSGRYFRGNRAILYNALCYFALDATGANFRYLGELWDACLANRAFTLDLTADFAGYTWLNFSRSTSQSLWFALEASA